MDAKSAMNDILLFLSLNNNVAAMRNIHMVRSRSDYISEIVRNSPCLKRLFI
jgi:hypothetical protein